MSTEPRLLLILGDQLSHDYVSETLGAVPGDDVILMVESADFVRRQPYHAKKIVLLWSAMRHFADELRGRGHSVVYVRQDENRRFKDAVLETATERGVKTVAFVRPREKATRRGLHKFLGEAGLVVAESADPFWYTAPDAFATWLASRKSPKMEDYYREVRRRHGILMVGNAPAGGEWNHDKQNRKPFPKKHAPIPPIRAEPDAITQEVMETVRGLQRSFGLYGAVNGFGSPVCRTDAEAALRFFVRYCLRDFGAYEDAMTTRDDFGFHSLLSIALNLSLLSPRECIDAAVAAYERGDVPINSVEGFVRQIIGWREFMYHMGEQFPGDYQTTNTLNYTRPLPAFYWTGDTKMRCLRHVTRRVLENGYSHHIERLMVLGNFALLYGANPHELNQWFWSLYLDAYSWVVTPNVVGMSQFADGGWVATKPYVSSGAYIDRMSDYCNECVYNPKEATGETACPFTTLYWSFLIEHEQDPLSQRMTQNLFGLQNKTAEERDAITARKAVLLTMIDDL
jgi:deoxyribodipyrimidine photolyase-related protein